MAKKWLGRMTLFAGDLLFLFPFYYMIVASLQKKPDTSLAGAFPTHGLTLDNYRDINAKIDLVGSLVNSGIFTGGVLRMTGVFGVLAGSALARQDSEDHGHQQAPAGEDAGVDQR